MQPPEPPLLTEKPKGPLVVGVSGHIDIKAPERVREKLAAFWETLRELAGKDTPVLLLTSIARGADHLATESCRSRGVKYCVVLPFAEEEYRKDFAEGQAAADFEEDLAGAYKVMTCDAAPGDYAAASDYVGKHCDLLLTMWDGYESLGPEGKPERGGTYHQIRTAFGMDAPLPNRRAKKHLVVNIAVERSRKGPAYHDSRGERRLCGFPEECGLSVLSCDAETKEIAAADFRQWAAAFRAGRNGAGNDAEPGP